MSVESFQFRYPLNRNPYVADQSSPIIYPYSRFASLETNPNLYVYGRQLPFRSYFGEDMNLSARPISRTIQPAILEYRPMSDNAKKDSCEPVAVTMVRNFVAYNFKNANIFSGTGFEQSVCHFFARTNRR